MCGHDRCWGVRCQRVAQRWTPPRRAGHIPNLDVRVKRTISSELRYSCVIWPTHLDNVAGKKENMCLKISGLLKSFFDGAWPLYWLEALSLLGAVQSASHGLLLVIKWLAVSVASQTWPH